MLKIIYDETGDNVDNKDVQWYVDQKLEDYFFSPIDDMAIMVSNIAVINQFAKYVEEFIPVFDVEFYWHDIKLDWDTYLDVNESIVELSGLQKIMPFKKAAIKSLIDAEKLKRQECASENWKTIMKNADIMTSTAFCDWCSNLRHLTHICVTNQAQDNSKIYIWYKNELNAFCFNA